MQDTDKYPYRFIFPSKRRSPAQVLANIKARQAGLLIPWQGIPNNPDFDFNDCCHWIAENVTANYYLSTDTVRFTNAEDALAFKLRWM